MSLPAPHVQNNGAHPFSVKERRAFFRLWAIRESLPARDRRFVEELSGAARLTAMAGIRLIALDSDDAGNVRADNVAEYRRRRDAGNGLALTGAEKKAARRARKAESRLALGDERRQT